MKMTKIEALRIALTTTTNDEAVEILNGMIAQLEKRASAPRKPSLKDIERSKVNMELSERLVKTLNTLYAPVCVKQIREFDPMFTDMTPQKIVSLLEGLVKSGHVIKSYNRRATMYSLPHYDEMGADE